MANYKVVDGDKLDADLQTVADAIKAKAGTEEKLDFPTGFKTTVENIATGSDITILEDMPIEIDFSNGDLIVGVPDGYAVKSAIIKQPETLIPENIANGVTIAGITGTNQSGSSEDVRYVTFMNGDVELYRKPVAVGDDCVDVVAKGLIPAPTKESTAQYNYTYYGWGAEDGGAADADILKNITEDKTVYAIYTEVVRTYTITYYDSDGTTVLKTEQVAYGRTPNYTPTKDGVIFDKWTPTPAAVNGDAPYVASWLEAIIILPETTVTTSTTHDSVSNALKNIFTTSMHSPTYADAGDKYTLIVNGVAYECSLTKGSLSVAYTTFDVLLLGNSKKFYYQGKNPSLIAGNTMCPICVSLVMDSADYNAKPECDYWSFGGDRNSTYTISILKHP